MWEDARFSADHAVTAAEVQAIANAHSAQPADNDNFPSFSNVGQPVKVGAGQGAYWYAPVTLTFVGTRANLPASTNGNLWRLSSEDPSPLDVELPASAIFGAPWLRTDGTNVTAAIKDAIQGDNEDSTLPLRFRVNVTNVDRYVSFSTKLDGGLQATIRIPAVGQASYNAAEDTDLQRLLKPAAWVTVGGYTMDVTTNATRSTVGTSITYAFDYKVVGDGAKPTGNALRTVTVVGEDVHRGQLERFAFASEPDKVPWAKMPAPLLGSVEDLGESDTDLVDATTWADVPDEAVLNLTVIEVGDNHKTYPSTFLKSDVASAYRWLGNVKDYNSGSRVELKTSAGKVVAKRAGAVNADNIVRIVRVG